MPDEWDEATESFVEEQRPEPSEPDDRPDEDATDEQTATVVEGEVGLDLDLPDPQGCPHPLPDRRLFDGQQVCGACWEVLDEPTPAILPVDRPGATDPTRPRRSNSKSSGSSPGSSAAQGSRRRRSRSAPPRNSNTTSPTRGR
jgi:hypothetical protein